MDAIMGNSPVTEQPLTLYTSADAEKALAVVLPEENTVDSKIQKMARAYIDKILTVDVQDLRKQQEYSQAIVTIGADVQAKLARKSVLLKEPMSALVADAEDGGPVATSLLNLQRQVSAVSPKKVNFNMGFLRWLISYIPGVGTTLSNWFAKYQTIEGVINDIINDLKAGQARLERDNVTLIDDQRIMRELTMKLQDYVTLIQLMDKALVAEIEGQELSEARKKFLGEEILFPLRQRIMDLQQELAVNSQGVISVEIVVRNNKELIRGVNRSLTITIRALEIASTLAVALQHQKHVLNSIQAVDKTAGDLLEFNAQQLKTQGVSVHKEASRATLNMEQLKNTFTLVEEALTDISTFRQNALPEMAKSIVDMDQIASNMEGRIQNMEQGNQVEGVFALQL